MRTPLTKSFLTLVLGTVAACSSSGTLELNPGTIDWGEVDFHNNECMDCDCADGCGLTPLFLNNVGEGPLEIQMPNGFDDTHLCIDGYESEKGLNLGTLAPGEFFLLNVSVCGYAAGELNTEAETDPRPVTGTLRFTTDGNPADVSGSFSFIPVRNQE
jgi:hypothetical protein